MARVFAVPGPRIAHAETGYVVSREDRNGKNRLIANSKFKALAGYTQDLGNDWQVGAQYLYEQTLDYNAYRDALLPADTVFDEFRHLLTQRVSKLFRNQTVRVSVFNFYSPSDRDGYLRASVAYDVTDQWKVTVGANVPWGEDVSTEFGQMERNQNVFTRVRYSF